MLSGDPIILSNDVIIFVPQRERERERERECLGNFSSHDCAHLTMEN